MRRGEVWRAFLPEKDGRIQSGARPVIVLQSDRRHLPTNLVVPLTSTLATTRFDGTLNILPDAKNGLTLPSVALVFQLRALDQRDFDFKLRAIDPAIIDDILTLLNELLEQ